MSLSQQGFADLREAYGKIYAPKFETILDEFSDQELDELTDDIIEEVVEEFFFECLEEGWDIESAEETLCESLETSLTMLNEVSDSYYADAVKSGKAKAAKAKRAEMIGKVKGAVKRVGSALKSGAKAAYKGANRAAGYAAGAAGRAASTAKSEFKKGYERGSKGSSSSSSDSSDSGSSDSGSSASSSASSSSGPSSSGRTRKAVGGALRSVGRLLKKGLKKSVGGTARAVSKGADKVASRLGEEAVGEGIDFKGAAREQARRDAIQAEKDKKSPSSKQRRLALGKFRPGASAEERAEGGRDAMREKGTSPTKNGKKMFEELQETGLFTEKEIQALMDAE